MLRENKASILHNSRRRHSHSLTRGTEEVVLKKGKGTLKGDNRWLPSAIVYKSVGRWTTSSFLTLYWAQWHPTKPIRWVGLSLPFHSKTPTLALIKGCYKKKTVICRTSLHFLLNCPLHYVMSVEKAPTQ